MLVKSANCSPLLTNWSHDDTLSLMDTLPLSTLYKGQRSGRSGQTVVMAGRGGVLDRLITPQESWRYFKYSNGFEWGYAGSGPAQLALAILLDFTRDSQTACLLHHKFKRDYVAGWEQQGFSITGAEIAAWLMQCQELPEPEINRRLDETID